jgi:hypothetical protein
MSNNWKEKYEDLLVNFKALDRHNDVLYRAYNAARVFMESVPYGSCSSLARDQLEIRLQEVANFEKNLKG